MKIIKEKNIRTCIISGKKLQKNDLIQIKIDNLGNFSTNKEDFFGRSVYLKKEKIEDFLKKPKNFLKNKLKKEFSEENFLKLKVFLKEIS